MSLILQINPSLERRIHQTALRRGVEMSQFVVQFLEANFPEEKPKPKKISHKEIELLKKIELAIPIEVWERYHILRAKRQNDSITSDEISEYTYINQQIETANVARLRTLIELAKIRKVSLDELMNQLGLTNEQIVA
jgi:hypothetical protein